MLRKCVWMVWFLFVVQTAFAVENPGPLSAQWFVICPTPLQASNVGKLSRNGAQHPKKPDLTHNGAAVSNMKCNDPNKRPLQVWAYRNTAKAHVRCEVDGRPATKLCVSWQAVTQTTDMQDGCDVGWAFDCYTEAMLK